MDDYIKDPSLVLDLSLWKRDGASFMSDDMYGHTCTVTEALWAPRGYILDGVNDKMTIPHHSSLNPSATLTIDMWAYPDIFEATTGMIYKGPLGSDHGAYYIRLDNTVTWKFSVNAGAEEASATNSLSAGRWQLVTATYDSVTLRLYVDGIEKGSTAYSTALAADANPLEIGRWFVDAENRYFQGSIGEVRIYSRCLNPAEVQHNYESTRWRYQ